MFATCAILQCKTLYVTMPDDALLGLDMYLWEAGEVPPLRTDKKNCGQAV
jgi:hypothetical protein